MSSIDPRVDIGHVHLKVADIDRSLAFWRDVLGFELPNDERTFTQHRAKEWIRVERYWEGTFPEIKARFLPVLCQHCE